MRNPIKMLLGMIGLGGHNHVNPRVREVNSTPPLQLSALEALAGSLAYPGPRYNGGSPRGFGMQYNRSRVKQSRRRKAFKQLGHVKGRARKQLLKRV